MVETRSRVLGTLSSGILRYMDMYRFDVLPSHGRVVDCWYYIWVSIWSMERVSSVLLRFFQDITYIVLHASYLIY